MWLCGGGGGGGVVISTTSADCKRQSVWKADGYGEKMEAFIKCRGSISEKKGAVCCCLILFVWVDGGGRVKFGGHEVFGLYTTQIGRSLNSPFQSPQDK